MHPLILVRRRNLAVLSEPRIGIRGRFHVELIHARTGLTKRVLDFENLITDVGLESIMTGWGHNQDYFDAESSLLHIAVGTGSTPPAVTDTDMEAQIASTGSSGGFSGTLVNATAGNNFVGSSTTVRLFGTASANGNLTEVGTRLGSSSGTLWSRTLFVDEEGDPTTIVKTEEDQLRITYTLEVQFDVTEHQQVDFLVPTPANPGGVPTLVTNRNSGATKTGASLFRGTFSRHLGGWLTSSVRAFESNVMPSLGSLPGDWLTDSAATDWDAYTPGTRYREKEAVFTASQANGVTGIGSITTRGLFDASGYDFVTTFNPKIPKTNLDRFVFRHRVHFVRV